MPFWGCYGTFTILSFSLLSFLFLLYGIQIIISLRNFGNVWIALYLLQLSQTHAVAIIFTHLCYTLLQICACAWQWWWRNFSVPARALIRERSKRRAELFSLSQSCSAARSQRLLMSLYCCWISKLSKSVGEIVLMVSRLEVNTFNLQFGHGDTKSVHVEREERIMQYSDAML